MREIRVRALTGSLQSIAAPPKAKPGEALSYTLRLWD
jgi:hypothetical protein